MKRTLLALCAVLFLTAGSVWAQVLPGGGGGGGSSGGSAITNSTAVIGPGNIVRAAPFAPIVVCVYPPTGGTPCTNYASTFTDPTVGTSCPSATPVVIPATSTCSGTSDKDGNFVIFVDPSVSSSYAYYFQYNNT